MNEKLKQLAEQAGLGQVYRGTQFPRYVGKFFHKLSGPTDGELEKFAELIVRECAEYLYTNYPHSRYEVNYMRKHMGDPNWNKPFGVEE